MSIKIFVRQLWPHNYPEASVQTTQFRGPINQTNSTTENRCGCPLRPSTPAYLLPPYFRTKCSENKTHEERMRTLKLKRDNKIRLRTFPSWFWRMFQLFFNGVQNNTDPKEKKKFLCSTEETQSYRFVRTWGWVNDPYLFKYKPFIQQHPPKGHLKNHLTTPSQF